MCVDDVRFEIACLVAIPITSLLIYFSFESLFAEAPVKRYVFGLAVVPGLVFLIRRASRIKRNELERCRRCGVSMENIYYKHGSCPCCGRHSQETDFRVRSLLGVLRQRK